MEPKRKILVVDDNKDLVEVMKLTLETYGFDCYEANSCKQGLVRLKEVCPDLVVLDVMMEDVTAGFRFVTKVRSDAPDSEFAEMKNIPILMLTAIEQKMKVKFKEKAGTALLPVDQFMSKPVPPKELYEKVCEMLKVATAGQS